MAEKKAIYKVKKEDGTYDEIHFKTVADQVKLSDTTTNQDKTLKSFFDGGGAIGGNLTVTGDISSKNVTATGKVSAADVEATGNLTIKGNATITGDVKGANIEATEKVKSKDVEVSNNINTKTLKATGDITTDEDVRAKVNIVAEGIVKGKTLQVTENATVIGDIKGNNITATGNMNVTGRYQSGSKILNLFDKDMCLDGNTDALRLKYNSDTYLALNKNGSLSFYNSNTPSSGNLYLRISAGSDKHTTFSNSTTMLKLLNGGTPQVQAMYAGNTGYCSVAGSEFKTASSQQYKTDIKEFEGNAIDILKNNNVKEYHMKTDLELVEKGIITQDGVSDKLGFILEELTDEAKRLFSPKGSDGIDSYCIVSMLWKVCQEQQVRIEQLEAKMLNA